MRTFCVALLMLVGAFASPGRADWVLETGPKYLLIHPGESISVNIYARLTSASDPNDLQSYQFSTAFNKITSDAETSDLSFSGGGGNPPEGWIFDSGTYISLGGSANWNLYGVNEGAPFFAAVGTQYLLATITITAASDARLGDQFYMYTENPDFLLSDNSGIVDVKFAIMNIEIVPEADVSLLMGIVLASGLGRYAMRKRHAVSGWLADFSARRQDMRRGSEGLVGMNRKM